LGKCRAEVFSVYTLLGEDLIFFINVIIKKEKSKAQRPRSVFFQIIFYDRGLDKLTITYYDKISIVKKSSFNPKEWFLAIARICSFTKLEV